MILIEYGHIYKDGCHVGTIEDEKITLYIESWDVQDIVTIAEKVKRDEQTRDRENPSSVRGAKVNTRTG